MNMQENNEQQRFSQLILASSSPRRKELVALLDLSLPVSVFSIDTAEHIQPSWSPAEAVQHISLHKGIAVARSILASLDTISYFVIRQENCL